MATEWSWPPQVAHTHTVVAHAQEKEMFILIRYILETIFFFIIKTMTSVSVGGGMVGDNILFSMLWNTLVIQ